MKKLFGTTVISLFITVFVVLPYVLLSEYVKEIRDFNIKLICMEERIKAVEKENRILQQDVEIINNIILSKDYIKKELQ